MGNVNLPGEFRTPPTKKGVRGLKTSTADKVNIGVLLLLVWVFYISKAFFSSLARLCSPSTQLIVFFFSQVKRQ